VSRTGDLHADARRNAVVTATGANRVADAFSFAQFVAGLRSAAKRTARHVAAKPPRNSHGR
jgi:hypothetical protein